MQGAKVSTVWVGYADFLNILFISFLSLFLIMFAQKADEDVYQGKVRDELILVLKPKLRDWNAYIEPDGTVTFNQPELLFSTGKSEVSPRFKAILDEFAPMYIGVLTDKRFKNKISQVRIEGHTSRRWNSTTGDQEAYLNNTKLSQARATSTMEYLLGLPAVQQRFAWISTVWAANGLSSSHPRPGVANPDSAAHQRVEFRFEVIRK